MTDPLPILEPTHLGGVWNGTRWCNSENTVYIYPGAAIPLGERLYTDEPSWIPPHQHDTEALVEQYLKVGAVLAGADGPDLLQETPGGGSISHYLKYVNPHFGDLDAKGNLGYNSNCVDASRALGQCLEGDPIAAGAISGVVVDPTMWGGPFMEPAEGDDGPLWIRNLMLMCPARSYAYVTTDDPAHMRVVYMDGVDVYRLDAQTGECDVWPGDQEGTGWAMSVRIKTVGGWTWWTQQ